MSYQSVVLADSPLYYSRGGTADLGSLGRTGTINGSVTTGQTGLLVGDSQTCDLFDGSTGSISFSDTGLPTGANPWSHECWMKPVAVTGNPVFFGFGIATSNQTSILYLESSTAFGCGGWISTYELDGKNAVANQVYYVLSTYDGANLVLYIGDKTANTLTSYGPKALAMNLTLLGTAYIGRDTSGGGDFCHTYIQERAIYGSALSLARATAHWNAGMTAPVSTTLIRGHTRSRGHILEVESVYR